VTERAPRAAGADRCPLCGEANGCAIAAQRQAPCWCVDASFDAALRARAARAEGPPRCICARCASAAVAAGNDSALTPPAR
jgi:hypothetical protein